MVMMSKAAIEKARKKPGGSNVGRFKNVKKSDFAGPAGGAPEGSFPINNKGRAKAALSRAHFAPNPAGIRRAVFKKFPSLLENSKFNADGKPKKKGK